MENQQKTQNNAKNTQKIRKMIYQSEIKNSIAVFDSGLGGLSVLCDLCKLPELANEKFFYFADS